MIKGAAVDTSSLVSVFIWRICSIPGAVDVSTGLVIVRFAELTLNTIPAVSLRVVTNLQLVVVRSTLITRVLVLSYSLVVFEVTGTL